MRVDDEATQDCQAERRVDLLLIEINDSAIQISNGNFSFTTFALVSSSRNRFRTFRTFLSFPSRLPAYSASSKVKDRQNEVANGRLKSQ